MRALAWDGAAARVVDRPQPEATADMAVVRVALAGICKTDLELVKGYMQFRGILGHEFVGTVDAGPAPWCGKRVVGEINIACGTCAMCTRGLGRHCPTRRVLGILNADGAFAEYVAVPVANLHEVPSAIDDISAVFTEPLAAAFDILAQVDVAPGTRALVFGDGKLGLLIAQVLQYGGAQVLLIGRHDAKLAIARARGITSTHIDQWNGAPAALVVEATGNAAGLAAALAATEPRGTLVLKSTVANPHVIDLSPLVINEVTLLGSRCGLFAPALRALEQGAIDVHPLVSAQHRLRDGVAALELAAAPGALKVLLRPD